MGQYQNPTGIFEEQNIQDHGIDNVDEDSNEEGRPIFGPLSHMINDQCRLELSREIPDYNINFGIDYYLKCVEIMERNSQGN